MSTGTCSSVHSWYAEYEDLRSPKIPVYSLAMMLLKLLPKLHFLLHVVVRQSRSERVVNASRNNIYKYEDLVIEKDSQK